MLTPLEAETSSPGLVTHQASGTDLLGPGRGLICKGNAATWTMPVCAAACGCPVEEPQVIFTLLGSSLWEEEEQGSGSPEGITPCITCGSWIFWSQ